MNTDEIVRLLQSYKSTRQIVRGVFACNRLPPDIICPSGYVCNTDPDFRPGEHWVAIYINHQGVGEYFDSFGLPPMQQDFIDFLNYNCSAWSYNKRTVQHLTSSACGLFCVYFLLMRCNGVSMTDLLGVFSDDLLCNDMLVTRFLQ